MFDEYFADKCLKSNNLISHHESLVAKIEFLAIFYQLLPPPDLLVNQYLLITEPEVTFFSILFLFRFRQEYFLSQKFKILNFTNITIKRTQIVFEPNIFIF